MPFLLFSYYIAFCKKNKYLFEFFYHCTNWGLNNRKKFVILTVIIHICPSMLDIVVKQS